MDKTHIIADTIPNWLSVPGRAIVTHYLHARNRFYENGRLYLEDDRPVLAEVWYFNRRADNRISKKEIVDVIGWSEKDIENLFQNPFGGFPFYRL